jgi:chromosome segregation ATPase
MLDAHEVEEVRRYATENGVSVEEAWAERVRWEAEAEMGGAQRRVSDAERAVSHLESELRAARAELARHRRRLASAKLKYEHAGSVRLPRTLHPKNTR